MSKRGNGEGTIYYSEKLNKWVGQFTAGRKNDGKLNRKSVYGNTRKEVKEKITKALAEIQNNTYIDKSNLTLIEVVKSYCEQQYNANKLSEASCLRKQETVKIISKLTISNMKIQAISIKDINDSLSELTTYSNSVIAKVCGLISTCFDYAILLKLINSNPFKIRGAIIRPKSINPDKKVDALTIEEQKLFIEQLNKSNDIYRDVFYIAIYSGMRVSEILALQGKDINLEKRTININKTLTKDINGKTILGKTTKTYSGTREIPFLDILYNILSKYTNKDFIFKNSGNFIEHNIINTHFKKICKDANIRVYTTKKKKKDKYVNLKTSKVNTHMLRHTFATRCIESGMSAVVLSKLLGHKDIETTLNTYTSVFNKFKKDELQKAEIYLKEII